MAAPSNNVNALTHGLTAGKLPKGCQYIQGVCRVLRQQVEGALVTNKGKVSLTESAVIQSVMRWERHALLCQRWLRLEAANMTCDQRLAYRREIARASSERDRCLRSLDLDRGGQDIISALYATTVTPYDECDSRQCHAGCAPSDEDDSHSPTLPQEDACQTPADAKDEDAEL